MGELRRSLFRRSGDDDDGGYELLYGRCRYLFSGADVECCSLEWGNKARSSFVGRMPGYH